MTGRQTDGRTAGQLVGCHPEGAYATEGAETQPALQHQSPIQDPCGFGPFAALRVTTVRLSARPADYHA
jgi:hypothetical protein